MTYRVYSPENEPFDIASKDRADDLVLNKGWTKQPQVQDEASADEDVPELPVTPRFGGEPGPPKRGRGRGKPAVAEAEQIEDSESWRIAQQPFVPIDDEPGLGD